LVKNLKYTESLAGSIYGAYTGLVYFTPLLGGFIADRYLGYKKTILAGGLLMMFGHFSLAIESQESFFLGLVLLILGNGFFKPNISTLIGYLYKDKPELKDSGFTIFYMGINIGGMIGPLLCGYIGEMYSWHYGFGLAGVGMFLGLLVFLNGYKNLPEKEFNSQDTLIEENLTLEEKNHIKVIFLLSIFTMFFWFAFEQAGSSMNLFADKYIDRRLFSLDIPASVFQALNGFLILLLAPLFSMIWQNLNKKNIQIYTSIQFLFAFVFLLIGFLVLVKGSLELKTSPKLSIYYILLPYLFHTMGELCISPVGLAMVSKLAPLRFTSMMMGFWFLSNAISHYIAGFVSGKMSSFQNLSDFFLIFVYTSIICIIILSLLYKKIHFMMYHKIG
jgi:POT family proton-dependent oligopeptide transporter